MKSKAYERASNFLDEALSTLGLSDDSPYDHANQSTTERAYGPDDHFTGLRVRDTFPRFEMRALRVTFTDSQTQEDHTYEPITIVTDFDITAEDLANLLNIPIELLRDQ